MSISQVVTMPVCYIYPQVDGAVTHRLAWRVAQSGEMEAIAFS